MKFDLDHIVISVRDLQKSKEFYESFLGKGTTSKEDISWKFGKSKLFITSPYVDHAAEFDKHNIGLNHIAFGVGSFGDLNRLEKTLISAGIKNSGIQDDKYSAKSFIWFDDPDNIRLEFYLR